MKLIIFSLLLCCQLSSFAWNFSGGVIKNNDDVQDSNGDSASNTFSPMFTLGHAFKIRRFYLSPHIGYSRRGSESNDSYGGDYTMTTIMLIYDAVWSPYDTATLKESPYAFRFGFGTFIRKTTGEGGTVQVPNGSSTSTAYKPEESERSYTASLNLGADLNLGPFTQSLKDIGLRMRLFIFSPLRSEKRASALSLGVTYSL